MLFLTTEKFESHAERFICKAVDIKVFLLRYIHTPEVVFKALSDSGVEGKDTQASENNC